MKVGTSIGAQNIATLVVFAQMVDDVEGIDEAVALHRLNVSTEFTPVQQRLRKFSTEKENAVKEEVAKF